jgi:hypothetical protein
VTTSSFVTEIQTQVNAINCLVQKVSKEIKDKPWHVEGQTTPNGF